MAKLKKVTNSPELERTFTHFLQKATEINKCYTFISALIFSEIKKTEPLDQQFRALVDRVNAC
jgi:hypothetical protein